MFAIEFFDIGANFIKGAHARRANTRHFDDVITKFGLDRPDNVPFLAVKDCCFKGWHHHATTKVAQIPTDASGTWVSRIFLGQFGKVVRIGFDFFKHLVSFFEGSRFVAFDRVKPNQNVAGLTLLRHRPTVLVLFIVGTKFFLVDLDVILHILRGEHQVLNRDFFRRLKLLEMFLIVGLDLVVGNGHFG